MTDQILPAFSTSSSRRQLLRGGGIAVLSTSAITLLAGCGQLARIDGTPATSSDIDILNAALAAENQAIAAYQLALDSRLLPPGTARVAQGFQADHGEHARALNATIARLGGAVAPARSSYDFPVSSLRSQADVLRFAAELERGAVAAYLAAVPQIRDRDVAKAAASILGTEAQHLAVLRAALGENPVPSAFVS